MVRTCSTSSFAPMAWLSRIEDEGVMEILIRANW